MLKHILKLILKTKLSYIKSNMVLFDIKVPLVIISFFLNYIPKCLLRASSNI